MVMKWSKTQQTGGRVSLIPIPSTGDPNTCPVIAFQQLVQMCPAASNDPLLMLTGRPTNITVDINIITREFQQMIQHINLSPKEYTLHSLRRGGASTSFQAGADSLSVQKHSQWTTDTFWQYIILPVKHATIPATLRKVVASTS